MVNYPRRKWKLSLFTVIRVLWIYANNKITSKHYNTQIFIDLKIPHINNFNFKFLTNIKNKII